MPVSYGDSQIYQADLERKRRDEKFKVVIEEIHKVIPHIDDCLLKNGEYFSQPSKINDKENSHFQTLDEEKLNMAKEELKKVYADKGWLIKGFYVNKDNNKYFYFTIFKDDTKEQLEKKKEEISQKRKELTAYIFAFISCCSFLISFIATFGFESFICIIYTIAMVSLCLAFVFCGAAATLANLSDF